MSIIYDYLKVLEKKRGVSDAAAQSPAAQSPAAQSPAQQKKTPAPAESHVALKVILVAAGIIFLFLFVRMRGSVPTRLPKTANTAQRLIPAPSSIRVGEPRTAYGVDYVLKGIIYNPESPTAIVNEKLIKPGAMIDDWRVMEILPGEVRMENVENSSVLTLKLKSALEQ